MHARDIMTAPVVCVAPDTKLVTIVELMLEHRISAVPVIDADGGLVGIVSEGDLMHRKELGVPAERSWWLSALGGRAMLAEEFVKAHATTAEELMTTEVIVVGEDTALPEIARQLERNRIKRVPVIAAGRVVGIVSRANLLQALSLGPAGAAPQPLPSDRQIRDRIMAYLAGEKWANAAHLNLVVHAGTVYLWGEIASPSHRKALIAAARDVPGVDNVVDHTRVFQTIY